MPNPTPDQPLKERESDGSTASYYELPPGATELQHLISYKNMNGQIAEIFRACYRNGEAPHSTRLRDAKKMVFYARAEVARLENPDTGFAPSEPSLPKPPLLSEELLAQMREKDIQQLKRDIL